MEQIIRKAVELFRLKLRYTTKALGLRVEHRCQRHEDGSYTVLIRVVPKGVGVDVGGVDGFIFNESRAFFLAGPLEE
jgi:hypothetical protein